MNDSVIAGALFDFMGWLTSRKERIVLSSADEASPAVDAIRDFAKMRGLSLDYAKVQDWHTTPQPAQQPAVPDAIHHTDISETLEYIQGWNDCRAAMLAEQPAQQCKWPTCQNEKYQQALAEQIKRELVGEQPAPAQGPAAYMYASIAGPVILHRLEQIGVAKDWCVEAQLANDMKAAKRYPKAHSCTPLYTTPQTAQQEPLTLQELEAAWNAQADKFNQWDELGLDEIVAWAQAVHGIKENT